MSTTADDDRRTARQQLTYQTVATRIDCDPEELRLFVRDHPNPTAAVIISWAEASPDHRKTVERWLATRQDRSRERADELLGEIDDEADTRYRSLLEGGADE